MSDFSNVESHLADLNLTEEEKKVYVAGFVSGLFHGCNALTSAAESNRKLSQDRSEDESDKMVADIISRTAESLGVSLQDFGTMVAHAYLTTEDAERIGVVGEKPLVN